MRATQQAAQPALDVDMTPLIDVTFLLIIFFMVVSVFNELDRKAELDLPVGLQSRIERDVSGDRMIVNVKADGTIVVSNQDLTMAGFKEQLRAYAPLLRRLGSSTGSAPIILRGDKACEYRHIRDILSAIYAEGFERIMFAALEPPRPKQD